MRGRLVWPIGRCHMPNRTNESRAVDIDELAHVDDDPVLSESGTHPVAVRPSNENRPSYRPVARSAEEAAPPIPEDPATTRARAAFGDVLAALSQCAWRLRRHG